MKKLLTICLLIASFTTKAQTLEQTMDFIEANVLRYTFDKLPSIRCSENALQKTTTFGVPDNSRIDYMQLYMKDIKSVFFKTTDKGFIILTVVGNCTLYENDKLMVDKVGPPRLIVGLVPSTPIENVNRIIKAIKHAATLEGAKLLDDDLFKD
jgi:hypothetical protein